jgi:hypothetical protein
MSAAEDAASFREECEECLAQAAKAPGGSTAAEQWLLFAYEWLKLAQAAEDLLRSDAAIIPAPSE